MLMHFFCSMKCTLCSPSTSHVKHAITSLHVNFYYLCHLSTAPHHHYNCADTGGSASVLEACQVHVMHTDKRPFSLSPVSLVTMQSKWRESWIVHQTKFIHAGFETRFKKKKRKRCLQGNGFFTSSQRQKKTVGWGFFIWLSCFW